MSVTSQVLWLQNCKKTSKNKCQKNYEVSFNIEKKKKLPKPQNDVFDRKTSRKFEIPQVTTVFRAKFYAE